MEAEGEHRYVRNPALTWYSVIASIIFAILGALEMFGGRLGGASYLAGAAFLFFNAQWCWRTPYLEVSALAIRIRPSLLWRSRQEPWRQVCELHPVGEKRVDLLISGRGRLKVRLNVLSPSERDAVVKEIERFSGLRLTRAST